MVEIHLLRMGWSHQRGKTHKCLGAFLHKPPMARCRSLVSGFGLVESGEEARLGNRAGSHNSTVLITFTGDVGKMAAAPHEESPIRGAV